MMTENNTVLKKEYIHHQHQEGTDPAEEDRRQEGAREKAVSA